MLMSQIVDMIFSETLQANQAYNEQRRLADASYSLFKVIVTL